MLCVSYSEKSNSVLHTSAQKFTERSERFSLCAVRKEGMGTRFTRRGQRLGIAMGGWIVGLFTETVLTNQYPPPPPPPPFLP
jgi:hypothetical protein